MKLCLFLFVIALLLSVIKCKLEPTKLVSGDLFKLQNQHDGRYLTATSNGQFARTESGRNPNQKFRFTLVEGNNVWTLTPQGDAQPNSIKWKVAYVGHGKYQFTNLATNMCLQASGAQESKCDKNEPKVRWFADITSAVEAQSDY